VHGRAVNSLSLTRFESFDFFRNRLTRHFSSNNISINFDISLYVSFRKKSKDLAHPCANRGTYKNVQGRLRKANPALALELGVILGS
jgi:hypothetical protein